VSCNKDDDPSLADLRDDKLLYLQDSLRISDSLRLIGNAGVVNYSITIVDGATSSIFANNDTEQGSRVQKTQSALADAIVTVSQYGKTLTDTTDASGMVVFNGFFRSAVNITISKADYTSVSYIAAVNVQDSTRTGTISFVGNIIPIFPLTGANTATISGRATIQTNLTNRVKEPVPTGTSVAAYIDATTNSDFSDQFLTTDIDDKFFVSDCGCQFVYVGNILQATYSTGIIGVTDATGNYSITVPAAVDGLPLTIAYSELAADQILYVNEGWPALQTPGDRTGTYRNLFGPGISTSPVPPGSDIDIEFESYTVQAAGNAIVSAVTGEIESITVTASGADYTGTPLVEITGGNGTGAVATAVVSNGKVVAVNIVSGGSGYTSPTVAFISGSNTTTAQADLDANNQRVFQIVVTNGGTGYTTAPTVTFTGTPGSGAAATAVISNQRVVAINVTNTGSGYNAAPAIGFTGGGGTGAAASASMGFGVDQITSIGGTNADHVYAPQVVFDAPDFVNGTRATGTAIIDPSTRTVTAIVVNNAGSGYTSSPVGVTLVANTGAAATADVIQTGGSVIGAQITNPGAAYAYPPAVEFVGGGGTGAAGTPIMLDGKVVGVTITSAGSGYTGPPEIAFISGSGATGYATVTNGAVSAITISDGGHDFIGAPRVVIGAGTGGGAAGTVTVAGGQITGVTVDAGGTGYLEGNIPGSPEGFNSTKGDDMITKPGIKYINDIHYGTGRRTTP
jgi:hypothetical protein